MRYLLPFALLPVACSGGSPVRNAEAEQPEFEVISRRPIGDAHPAEIGRYQYHPASGEMPALLLDTASGCVEVFEKITLVDNPKDIRWVRRYQDGTLPLVTYSNGVRSAVSGTSPPQRCNIKKASIK